ncbi:alpha-1-antitrypsin homolog isoform X1 [Colossoma macropomum]|uniref:alpha-1-antitrypsin homolog isoform X1 n=1 Tax=Colossoma macropomum TaxID=42526 RepID=UPI0018654B25|nr:alpha-1-antitrypsin homolog isoform X1 [Colossoma macropomum]XP_036419117.1 alpha-1-antitrypsin homolog isoform X1 [Colossoma macropomum]
MCGKISCCFLVSLLLTVTWAAQHGHEDHSADHHQHLHHGKDEPHPSHDGDEDLSHRLAPHNADFTFSLYRKLAAHPETQGKNIFFSPLSISMALSMLALGAKGETHSQIFSTLGYSALTPDQVNEGYEHLFHMLGHSQDAMLLEAGSAVAVREGFKAVDKFLKDAQHYYQGEALSVDFSKPTVAEQEINKYIAKKTKDMITDMIKELDQDTMMMLINYIYFRGKWKKPFDIKYTEKADFHVDENTTVTVNMMRKETYYEYYRDRNNFTSIIMVPYKGDTSMMIVLPDEGKMQELEKNIDKDHLKYWHDKLYGRYVKLFMPKFSISASFSLADTLMEMGIVSAFSSSADFSGINEETNLKVSKVLHQAVLKVDEKGTEAAAVTTSLKIPYSVSPTMNVNRPFLVFIVEESTKSILFMGKITNPTA